MRHENILGVIGDTPLVGVHALSPNPDVRIFAKLEMANPTGSVKDRVAKYLIEDLETRGLLRADSIILEPTSGNTGIALAMIGRRRGYRRPPWSPRRLRHPSGCGIGGAAPG